MSADDGTHPNDLGHRAMADLAVWLVQQTAIDLIMRPFGQEEAGMMSEPMPLPMYKGEQERSLTTIVDRPTAQHSQPTPTVDPHLFVPLSICVGNEAPSSAMCLTQDAMLPLVLPPHDGWAYVDEGKEGKPKKGFVSTKPGGGGMIVTQCC